VLHLDAQLPRTPTEPHVVSKLPRSQPVVMSSLTVQFLATRKDAPVAVGERQVARGGARHVPGGHHADAGEAQVDQAVLQVGSMSVVAELIEPSGWCLVFSRSP
jgi:hypothetical protein